MSNVLGNVFTYILWFVSFIVIFNLLKKKAWPRFWRWLLSIVLGYVAAGVVMVVIGFMMA